MWPHFRDIFFVHLGLNLDKISFMQVLSLSQMVRKRWLHRYFRCAFMFQTRSLDRVSGQLDGDLARSEIYLFSSIREQFEELVKSGKIDDYEAVADIHKAVPLI
jgi:hypothetical protein